MSNAHLPAHMKINLETSTVLLVDDNQMSLEILSSVFYGFGARDRLKCADLTEAKAILTQQHVDLLVIDSGFPDEGSFKFMHWLRREAADPVCFTPTIIISGHSTRASVRKARDSGGHFVVAKPITAGVLLNRIAWIAHEKRPFVTHDIYAGPDRRWKNSGLPPGTVERRANAVEPAPEQDNNDGTFEPQKVSA